jgi:ABC-type uncharacterized transport system substrate-binding protein
MKRRAAVLALWALLGVPLIATGQQVEKRWRVGAVYGGSALASGPYRDAFLMGLKERGYEVGRNLTFEVRYADARPERYSVLVDEILALKPDVLIGANTPVALEMKRKAGSIPIVLTTSGDPVGDGLVQSLARPGGNVTGNSSQVIELGAKHIEVLTELLPSFRRVALFLDQSESAHQTSAYEKLVNAAASAKGVAVDVHRVTEGEGIRKAFQAMQGERPDALILMPSARLNSLRREISQRALAIRLPSISFIEDYVEDGGLLSYGPSWIELNRRAAYFVDRILKGAKPADLPLQQPTKFLLFVNARTAQAIGVAIPKPILLRADRVIE